MRFDQCGLLQLVRLRFLFPFLGGSTRQLHTHEPLKSRGVVADNKREYIDHHHIHNRDADQDAEGRVKARLSYDSSQWQDEKQSIHKNEDQLR